MTERTTAIDWRRVVSTALGVLAGAVATAGTLAVAVAGFTLSYDAIRKVGIAAGIRPDWAWLLPVSIDGAMAVGTVTAVVMSRMGRSVWYPWLVVLAGAGISIACNALHAQMRDQIKLDDNTAMAVSAIPAVMLALSVHLLVVLIDAAARTFGAPDTTTDTDADTATSSAIDPAPVDADVTALCDEILRQARRARLEVNRSLLWRPAPVPFLPVAHVVTEPVRVTAIEADAISTTTAPAVSEPAPAIEVDTTPATAPAPKRTPARTPARTVTRTTERPAKASDVATKAAKILAKTPGIKQAELAAKLGVSERTLRRHLNTAEPDTTPDTTPDTRPVNGQPVPTLIDA